jgi:hypothetical protein
MGMECPECKQHGAFVFAITASGEPAKTATDIIARKLSCGHSIGNADYMAYRKELAAVEEDEANKIRAIKAQGQKKRTDIWAAITNPIAGE